MSYLFLNLVLAAVPSFILIVYFYRKDSQKKEPVQLVLKVFIFGFISVIPAIIAELTVINIVKSVSPLTGIIIRAFIVAGLVEEATKLLTVMFSAFQSPYFDEVTDGIVYTVTASLGFAFFENAFYSLGPVYVLIIRGLTAVPMHAIASGIMGYYIGRSKFENPGIRYRGLLLAVLVHGFYDFFLFYGSWMTFLIFPLLIFAGKILAGLYRSALNEDREFNRS